MHRYAEHPPTPWVWAYPAVTAASVAMVAFSLAFGIAATHDYLEWNRASWAAADALHRKANIFREEIDAGWEFNNYVANSRRLYYNRSERDLDKGPDERTPGGSVDGRYRRYRVAVSPWTGYEVIERIPISTWLPLDPRAIYVLKRR